jgi:ADP-heptose:LPS heptosyltransferase
MIDESARQPVDLHAAASSDEGRLNAKRVTLLYTMYHHLGDFVVMGGLLKKFDLLGVEFESLVAHRHSPHVAAFDGKTEGRFFNIAGAAGFFELVRKLRRQRQEGRFVLGLPMAPGSLQAFLFFWILKKLGALTYIVDFNLINADILTPVRRRYIFDRHLAQAAEIFKRPEWMEDVAMPLAISAPAATGITAGRRIGFFPWSGRSWMPEFQWPDSRWLDLAKLILGAPEVAIVLVGKDDGFARFKRTLCAGLSEEMQRRIISSPAASVSDLVVTLRGLDGLITLNTSALHIAHALQLPMIALCGSSAEFWLPEGHRIRVVRDSRGALPASDRYRHDPLQPSVQRIEVSEVYSACKDIFHLSTEKSR